MNPLRWDVLLVGFVLALPVFALWFRGDFSTEEAVGRLPWCLAAGWGAVALVRAVATPPPAPRERHRPVEEPAD
ncbi:hypothetical protein [Blastococcus xanthinilyticus]|uniref:Uncharacterized protein n=1 Tax=Blastococcus xanthinilyticus TaxID=1564164 RepID=A0A5S5CTV6_9ACTN|nr:hypothetical protein [Blastococcus xanthinilyticus]TYP86276.1 hypothetical protein BD833_110167 [Blastococcus xanthinilyticus]